ncbi:MAG: hypothetical protein ACR9NN_25180 [Nostochopsis sp.]
MIKRSIYALSIALLVASCLSKEKLQEKQAKVAKDRINEFLKKDDSLKVLNDSTRDRRMKKDSIRLVK